MYTRDGDHAPLLFLPFLLAITPDMASIYVI